MRNRKIQRTAPVLGWYVTVRKNMLQIGLGLFKLTLYKAWFSNRLYKDGTFIVWCTPFSEVKFAYAYLRVLKDWLFWKAFVFSALSFTYIIRHWVWVVLSTIRCLVKGERTARYSDVFGYAPIEKYYRGLLVSIVYKNKAVIARSVAEYGDDNYYKRWFVFDIRIRGSECVAAHTKFTGAKLFGVKKVDTFSGVVLFADDKRVCLRSDVSMSYLFNAIEGFYRLQKMADSEVSNHLCLSDPMNGCPGDFAESFSRQAFVESTIYESLKLPGTFTRYASTKLQYRVWEEYNKNPGPWDCEDAYTEEGVSYEA